MATDRRPSRRIRADEDDIYPTFLGSGSAHSISGPYDEPDQIAGVILVPDPEQRHGWREFYVHRPAAPKPGARPIGFGRP